MSRHGTLEFDDILPPLTIETLVNGGAGLARYKGRVMFIPHTAAGDLVRCQIVKSKKKFAEAKLIEVVEPAAGRISPVCPVAGDCGGCQWQHLPYSEQSRWKERLFRETLVRARVAASQNIKPLLEASQPFNYRSRVQIKCHNTAAGFVTGFYRAKSRFVVSINQCPLMPEGLNSLLQLIKNTIDGSEYARFIPQIDLAIDDSGKRSTVIHYLGEETEGLIGLLEPVSVQSDLILQAGRKDRRALVSGNGLMTVSVDHPPLMLKYQAGGFAQINLEQNRRLVDEAMALIPWKGDEAVIDLYCGMGNFSLPLARRAGSVIGVEESEISVRMARQNAVENSIENICFIQQAADTALKKLLSEQKINVVFLDPPRSGAYNVMNDLVTQPVDHIIYVSCDPQTLARDLSRLVKGGYEVVAARPVDMFPQTYHCESVTCLRRKL